MSTSWTSFQLGKGSLSKITTWVARNLFMFYSYAAKDIRTGSQMWNCFFRWLFWCLVNMMYLQYFVNNSHDLSYRIDIKVDIVVRNEPQRTPADTAQWCRTVSLSAACMLPTWRTWCIGKRSYKLMHALRRSFLKGKWWMQRAHWCSRQQFSNSQEKL